MLEISNSKSPLEVKSCEFFFLLHFVLPSKWQGNNGFYEREGVAKRHRKSACQRHLLEQVSE